MHNVIIENFREIREELVARGCSFTSDTDTEVVAHLITSNLNDGMDPVRAAAEAFTQLTEAFALAVIFSGEHDLMIGARRGSPLVVGLGETMDTMEALRMPRRAGQKILSIVNVPHSTMVRESDDVLVTHAGPEIGVASTKAFTTQLTTLLCLAIAMGRARGVLAENREAELVQSVSEVPAQVAEFLTDDATIRKLARDISHARDVLFLGRGASFPIAMEGALKLKEISYIHAEGYAAGEMKHGPIALIDEEVRVVIVAPPDNLFGKIFGNAQESAARSGRVVVLSDDEGIARMGEVAWATIPMPTVDPAIAPILYAIPVQVLAYHVALIKGIDVDQPRNLAKSVTVE